MSTHPLPPRQRFYKPWHFLRRAGRQPQQILQEVFSHYPLPELEDELDCCVQLALCNDNSAYETAGAREDLMDFTRQLHQLIKAFYILNKSKNADERETHWRVIARFCKTFRRSYAQMELLDMLDAVITYQGDKEVYKGNLVLLYELLYSLVKLAYCLCKSKGHFHFIPQH